MKTALDRSEARCPYTDEVAYGHSSDGTGENVAKVSVRARAYRHARA